MFLRHIRQQFHEHLVFPKVRQDLRNFHIATPVMSKVLNEGAYLLNFLYFRIFPKFCRKIYFITYIYGNRTVQKMTISIKISCFIIFYLYLISEVLALFLYYLYKYIQLLHLQQLNINLDFVLMFRLCGKSVPV